MYYIKNAQLIDQTTTDIYIINNQLYTKLPVEYHQEDFEQIFLDDDEFVSYGWIDSHVHCDDSNQLYGAKIDDVGYKQGVSLVIDAGSCGIDNINQLYEQSLTAITNVKALLNISRLGIFKQSELADLAMINVNYDQKKYHDFIVGYKVRMSSSVTLATETKALEIFDQMRSQHSLPMMVHIGNEPPNFKQVSAFLRTGDIITHALNFKNDSLFNQNGETSNAVKELQTKKINFDLGHGSESFNALRAQDVFDKGFKLNLVSSDIYRTNQKNQVVGSLALTLSKLHALGISWAELIDLITIQPSKIFNLKGYGEIKDGNFANLTIFKIKNESKKVVDSFKNNLLLTELIEPSFVIINGIIRRDLYEN